MPTDNRLLLRLWNRMVAESEALVREIDRTPVAEKHKFIGRVDELNRRMSDNIRARAELQENAHV